jgi:hypothetical protein
MTLPGNMAATFMTADSKAAPVSPRCCLPKRRVRDDQRGRFREGARLIHGAGHYELRRAEALAVWRTA